MTKKQAVKSRDIIPTDEEILEEDFEYFQKFSQELASLLKHDLEFNRGKLKFQAELVADDEVYDMEHCSVTFQKPQNEEERFIAKYLKHNDYDGLISEYIYSSKEYIKQQDKLDDLTDKIKKYTKFDCCFSIEDVFEHANRTSHDLLYTCMCHFCSKNNKGNEISLVEKLSLREREITINGKNYRLVNK